VDQGRAGVVDDDARDVADVLPAGQARGDLRYLKGGPEYTVFAKETQTARSRTTQYGANRPKVSQALWTAIRDYRHVVGQFRTDPGAVHHFPYTAGQGELIAGTVRD
jgi:hypothetical protein